MAGSLITRNSKNRIREEFFLTFINALPLTVEEKKYITNELAAEDYNIQAYPNIDSTDGYKSFIVYLHQKYKELGIDYIRDAIEYAKSYKEDYSNFIEQFTKFIVITNFDEIEVAINDNYNGIENQYLLEAKLGGLLLSDNRNMTYNKEDSTFEFEWFHNRPGLKRTKLGSLTMRELFKYIQDCYPGTVIFGGNLRKDNESAKEFYKSVGFEVIDKYPEGGNYYIEISPEKQTEFVNKHKEIIPSIIFNGKEINYKTYKTNIKKNL